VGQAVGVDIFVGVGMGESRMAVLVAGCKRVALGTVVMRGVGVGEGVLVEIETENAMIPVGSGVAVGHACSISTLDDEQATNNRTNAAMMMLAPGTRVFILPP